MKKRRFFKGRSPIIREIVRLMRRGKPSWAIESQKIGELGDWVYLIWIEERKEGIFLEDLRTCYKEAKKLLDKQKPLASTVRTNAKGFRSKLSLV